MVGLAEQAFSAGCATLGHGRSSFSWNRSWRGYSIGASLLPHSAGGQCVGSDRGDSGGGRRQRVEDSGIDVATHRWLPLRRRQCGRDPARALGQLPYIGALLTVVALGVFIIFLWAEPSSDQDLTLRMNSVILVLGLAATFTSVLALPSLPASFEVARLVAFACTIGLAIMTIIGIVTEEFSLQIYAVLVVILTTATIALFVGAFIASRSAPEPAPRRAMHCPSCATVVGPHVMSGEHSCHVCGLGFRLTVSRPAAPHNG